MLRIEENQCKFSGLFCGFVSGFTGGLVRSTTGQILLTALFEVGLVPATALEPKTRRRDLLLQAAFTAFRAIRQGGITDFLDCLQLVATVFTLIFIDRHIDSPNSSSDTLTGRRLYASFAGLITPNNKASAGKTKPAD